MRARAPGWVLAFVCFGLAHASAPGRIAPSAAATPEQVAIARIEGDALLAESGAQDLFDNETGSRGATIVLRHRESGFACLFTPGQPLNEVIIYPGARRGDDVGCDTGAQAGSRTTNFTRDAASDDATIRSAGSAIQRWHPDAQVAPPPVRAGSPGPTPSTCNGTRPSRTA